MAGKLASKRYAHHESISHYRNALAALAQLEKTPARVELALRSQIAIGGALAWTAGSASDESGSAFAAARELCMHVKDDKLFSRTLLGSIGYHALRAQWSDTESFANQLLDLARKNGAPVDYLTAYVSHGERYLWQGHIESAKTHLDKALELDTQLSTAADKAATSPWARVSMYS